VARKYAFNPPKIRFHFSFRKFTSNATAQKKNGSDPNTRREADRRILPAGSVLLSYPRVPSSQSTRTSSWRSNRPQSGEGDLLCVYHADGRWKPSGWRHARLSSQCTHSCSLLFARRPLPMRCRAERGREGRSIFGLFPASVASRESRSSASNPRLFVHEGSAFETVLET
jgi:hypothetical protein